MKKDRKKFEKSSKKVRKKFEKSLKKFGSNFMFITPRRGPLKIDRNELRMRYIRTFSLIIKFHAMSFTILNLA